MGRKQDDKPEPAAQYRGKWPAIAGAAVAVLAVGTWLLWPESHDEPRQRTYREYTACLLTDDGDPNGPNAGPIWAGMQKASLDTHAQAQFLRVTEPLTPDNAKSTLASMTQGRCNLVFAAGDASVTAVRADAAKYSGVHFYLLGGGTDTANLTHIPASADKVTDAVAQAVVKAAGPA